MAQRRQQFEKLQWKMSGGMQTVNCKYKSGILDLVYDDQRKCWQLCFFLKVQKLDRPIEKLQLDPNKLEIRCRPNLITIMYKEQYKQGQPMYYIKALTDTVSYTRLCEALDKIAKGEQTVPTSPGTTPLSEKQHSNTNPRNTSTPRVATPHSKDVDRKSPREWTGQPLPIDLQSTPNSKGHSKSEPSSASKRFLQTSQEKSQGSLDTALSSGNFYKNSTPNSRSYGPLSTTQSNVHKRGPGLLPVHQKAKRMRAYEASTNYSWSSRSPSVPPENQSSLQGFSNLGNTCYMNAILQALFGLDCFTTDLLRTLSASHQAILSEQRMDYLCFAIGKLLVTKRNHNNLNSEHKRQLLSNVKKAISSSAKRFSGNNQHDAHEFLSLVLDQCKEEIIKISKELPDRSHRGDGDFRHFQEIDGLLNPTKYNFEMEVEHTFTCQRCLETVAKQETFNDLSLDVPRNRADVPHSSIQDALDKFFLTERIEYTCEKCEAKEAEVTHSFVKLPRVLVLHLKRYSFLLGSQSHGKLGRSIIIPKYLTLGAHCTNETSPPHPPQPPFIPSQPKSTSTDGRPYQTPTKPQQQMTPKNNVLPNSEPRRFKFTKNTLSLKRRHSDEENRPVSSLRDTSLTEEEELERVMALSLAESKRARPARRLLDSDPTAPEMSEEAQLAMAMKLSVSAADGMSANQEAEIFESANGSVAMETDGVITQELNYAEEAGALCSAGNDENAASQTEESAILVHGVATIQGPCIEAEDPETFELYFQEEAETECMAANEIIDESSESDDEVSLLIVRNPNDHSNQDAVKPKGGVSDDEVCLLSVENPNDHSVKEGVKPKGCGRDSVLCDRCGAVSVDKDCGCSGEDTTDCQSNCDNQGTVDKKPSLWSRVSSQIGKISSKFTSSASQTKKEETADCKRKTEDSETDTHWDLDSPGADYNKENHSPPVLEKFDTIDLDGVAGDTAEQPQQTVTEEEALKQAIENSLLEQELNLDPDEAEQIRKAKELSLQEINFPFGSDAEEEEEPASPLLCRSEEENEEMLRNAETGELPFSYRLVSVVSHLGQSSTLGHYISDVYDVRKKQWSSYDDTHVSSISEEDVRKTRDKTGYIFFYISNDTLQELEDYISTETVTTPRR